MKIRYLLFSLVLILAASPLLGANATFTPTGSTIITAGTPMVFNIGLQATTLSSFDSADIVIGANDAAGISFVYSSAWMGAFADVTTPNSTYDTVSYDHSLFVGGNTGDSGGTSLSLGTLTIDTAGLAPGSYLAQISFDIDGTSELWYAGDYHEAIEGIGAYEVTAVPEPGTIMAGLALLAPAGVFFRRRRTA